MHQNKNITSLIKYLFSNIKNRIIENPFSFMSLVATHSLLLILITLSNTWINENVDIFKPITGIVILRISISLIISGIWIGYFKLILNYIDNKKYNLKDLFVNFHLLPKIIAVQAIYYISTLPVILYFIVKHPYDITKYGTDINNYFYTVFNNISTASISISFLELCIIIILSMIPMIYLLKFWCAELLIVDEEISIKNALIQSYTINSTSWPLIVLMLGVLILNILSMVFGYFVFIITLTLSYVILCTYYRLLKK